MRHEIDIPGLPEGYKPVGYRPVSKGDMFFNYGRVHTSDWEYRDSYIIVEKIKPQEKTFRCVSPTKQRADNMKFFLSLDGSMNRCVPDGVYLNIWEEVTEQPEEAPEQDALLRGSDDNESREAIKTHLASLLSRNNESAQGNLYVLLMDVADELNVQCADISDNLLHDFAKYSELRDMVEKFAIKCDEFKVEYT